MSLRHSNGKRIHGMHKSKTYRCWWDMWQRCKNPKLPNYRLYGGRGIVVCERWSDFRSFLADMGERPEGAQLDRINNEGNYEPGNCRWATPTENSNNHRANRRITIKGETHTLAEWLRLVPLKRETVFGRIYKYGWSEERALTQPLARSKS